MRRLFLALGIVLITATLAWAVQRVSIVPLTIGVQNSTVTVATTATALPGTALVGRESIAIFNNGTATVFIGDANVTTANGYPLTTSLPAISLDLDSSVILYGIVASGTQNCRVLEAK